MTGVINKVLGNGHYVVKHEDFCWRRRLHQIVKNTNFYMNTRNLEISRRILKRRENVIVLMTKYLPLIPIHMKIKAKEEPHLPRYSWAWLSYICEIGVRLLSNMQYFLYQQYLMWHTMVHTDSFSLMFICIFWSARVFI